MCCWGHACVRCNGIAASAVSFEQKRQEHIRNFTRKCEACPCIETSYALSSADSYHRSLCSNICDICLRPVICRYLLAVHGLEWHSADVALAIAYMFQPVPNDLGFAASCNEIMSVYCWDNLHIHLFSGSTNMPCFSAQNDLIAVMKFVLACLDARQGNDVSYEP